MLEIKIHVLILKIAAHQTPVDSWPCLLRNDDCYFSLGKNSRWQAATIICYDKMNEKRKSLTAGSRTQAAGSLLNPFPNVLLFTFATLQRHPLRLKATFLLITSPT